MATPIQRKRKQSGRIKRVCFLVFLSMITLLTLNACGDPELDSRKELVALGFTFDVKNFMKAVSQGDEKIIELFLTAGIGKNRDAISFGLVPAIAKDQPEMVTLLLDKGADPNIQSDDKHSFQGGTPLTLAISLEKMDMVKILLDRGANPDTESQNATANGFDGRGGTPLMRATAIQEFDMVELLLEKGANPNLASKKGKWKGTPLALAVDKGFAGIEEILKAEGAK